MALNLPGGYGLVAHDIDRGLDRARDATGGEARALLSAGERCEAVLRCFSGRRGGRVWVGGAGIAARGLSRGSVLVDMSSSSPLGTRSSARGSPSAALRCSRAGVGGREEGADATTSPSW